MFGIGNKKGEAAPAQHAGSGKTYVVKADVGKCIGAAVCEAFAPAVFQVQDTRKVTLLGGRTLPGGWEERDISEAELDACKQAADGCPPKVIHIYDTRSGERII